MLKDQQKELRSFINQYPTLKIKYDANLEILCYKELNVINIIGVTCTKQKQYLHKRINE